MDSYCEILGANNSGSGLGRHPTAYYGSEADVPTKQAIRSQNWLRSKMIGIWIKNFLTTYAKCKLRDFITYTFNNQDDGSATFFCYCKNGAPWHMCRRLIHKYKAGNYEDVSVQTRYPQIKPTDRGMDERDINSWGNLFRNYDSAIQPLIRLIISTLQGLYGDQ